MEFARQSHECSPTSRSSRRRCRPTRACHPALGRERFEDRTLLSTALVSINAAGTASGKSDSDFTSSPLSATEQFGVMSQSTQANVSADGTRVVFVSDATDIVASQSESPWLKRDTVYLARLHDGNGPSPLPRSRT